jgi:hypothetical protein
MNPRLRRAIAAVGVLVFLTLYVWGVISLSPFIPEVWWAQLLYFGIAGTAWGVPILPLLTWAEKGGE